MRNHRSWLVIIAILVICAVPMVTALVMAPGPGWFVAACVPLLLAVAAVFHNAVRGDTSPRLPRPRPTPRHSALSLFLTIVALPTALLAFVALFSFGLGLIFSPLALLIVLAYGWLLFAFLHY